MILEAAMLHIRSGQSEDFEASFREASAIIASMKGYIRRRWITGFEDMIRAKGTA